MKILVTGGVGYIGSHTCVELINAGYEPIVIDNYCNAFPEVADRVKAITGKSLTVYDADVRDRAALDRIFTEHKIEYVIHFAGLKAVGESCSKPLEYYDNNIYGTLVLLEAMRAHGVKRIVFSSSATVYGIPVFLPFTEEHPLGNTTNPYSTSKFQQEQILRDLYVSDNDWTVVILRYFNPVGAHDSGMIGEDPQGIPNNLTPYITRVISGQLPCVNVFGNDYKTHDGTGVRDYIHVVDLAKGHVAVIDKLQKPGVFTYNLGTGVGYSVLDVLHSFEKACGHDIPHKFCPRRPGDIDEFYADSTKAKNELGWEAKYNLDDMSKSCINWQTKNPKGYRS